MSCNAISPCLTTFVVNPHHITCTLSCYFICCCELRRYVSYVYKTEIKPSCYHHVSLVDCTFISCLLPYVCSFSAARTTRRCDALIMICFVLMQSMPTWKYCHLRRHGLGGQGGGGVHTRKFCTGFILHSGLKIEWEISHASKIFSPQAVCPQCRCRCCGTLRYKHSAPALAQAGFTSMAEQALIIPKSLKACKVLEGHAHANH